MAKLEANKFNDEFCDFTIKVEQQSFRVHRVVLDSCSEYFRAMFENDMLEARQKFCEVREVSAEPVKLCIDFIYGNEIKFDMDNVVGVLQIAHMWQLEEAVEKCVDFLHQQINISSCVNVMHLSRLYSFDKLGKVCMDFIVKNVKQIPTKSLKTDDIIAILQHDEAKNISVKELWSICVEREKSMAEDTNDFPLCKIIAAFPKRYFSPKDFKTVVWTNKHVTSCDECASRMTGCFLDGVSSGVTKIDKVTCLFVKKLAKKCKHPAENKIDEFIFANRSSVFQDAEFNLIDEEDLIMYVMRITQMTTAEFSAIINWLTFSDKRCDVFPKIFKERFRFKKKELSFMGLFRMKPDPFTLTHEVLLPSNCFFVKTLSKKCQCFDAESWVDSYIVKNFELISKNPEFNKLEVDDIAKYLAAVRKNELVVWDAVTSWTKYDLQNRRDEFLKLFEALNLQRFSTEFIRTKVCKYDLVRNSVECMNQITEISFLKIERANKEIEELKMTIDKHDREIAEIKRELESVLSKKK